MYAVQTIVDAASLGSLYALVALGIGLIFGIMRLINFAHGDLITLGAYALIVPSTSATATLLVGAWPSALMVATVILFVMLVALLTERLAFRPLRDAPPATLLIGSFAIAFFLQNVVLAVYGSRPKALGIGTMLSEPLVLGGIRILKLDLVVIGVTLFLMISLTLFLKRTRYGMWMRAAAEDFSMARVLGVRANTVIAIAFAISGLLAAVVALLVVVKSGLLSYRMGVPLVLMGFVATVIGGMGSLVGAALGGFIVGVVSVALQVVLPTGMRNARDAFVFIAVILILLWRPGGIVQVAALRERV
jgi:branched-chain amino acid transport system permease protein